MFSFFQKKNPAPEATSVYKELFAYLKKQITVPKNAAQLVHLAKDAVHRNEGIFHSYLLFEKYLCSFEPEMKFTRGSLRNDIRQRFPELQTDRDFAILFLKETERKNTLAIQFLLSFLGRVNERFGRAGEGYFEKKSAEIRSLDYLVSDERLFAQLQLYSFPFASCSVKPKISCAALFHCTIRPSWFTITMASSAEPITLLSIISLFQSRFSVSSFSFIF